MKNPKVRQCKMKHISLIWNFKLNVSNYWHRFLWGLFVPAARLLRGMRRDIDPCDDFFEYACGSWNKINVIPEDRSGYNTFAKLRDDLQVILKGTTCFRVALSSLFNINHAIWLKKKFYLEYLYNYRAKLYDFWISVIKRLKSGITKNNYITRHVYNFYRSYKPKCYIGKLNR